MATNKPRYSITLDEEMFRKVEDFRFDNRFQTRNDATVELIRRGLEMLESEECARCRSNALATANEKIEAAIKENTPSRDGAERQA